MNPDNLNPSYRNRSDQTIRCSVCNMEIGNRKIAMPSDGSVVHTKHCFVVREREIVAARNAARQASENVERSARAEVQNSNQIDRGTLGVDDGYVDLLDAWIKKAWRDGEETKLSYVMQHVLYTVKGWKEVAKTFTKDVVDSPCHTLEWSSKVFTAAAKYEVGMQLINGWACGMTEEEISANVTQYTLRGAASPSHSTSMQSNQIDEQKTVAWAEIAQRFNGTR